MSEIQKSVDVESVIRYAECQNARSHSVTMNPKMENLATERTMEKYGLIGDMSSAALVGTDGSIDWCCFPRFDSPSVFAAILDENEGGSFQICPTDPMASVRQAYVPDTNVLCTRFRTATGEMTVTDFMPVAEDADTRASAPHELHRIVRCESGSVEVALRFGPRLDYARGDTTFTVVDKGVVARGTRQVLTLCADRELEVGKDEARLVFPMTEGQESVFVLAYGHRRSQKVEAYQSRHRLTQTMQYWNGVVRSAEYDGLWRDEVIRSFLVLHLMMYRRTGAIIAAPTTSLPEGIGGSRNWDYRYAWLRDSAFTVEVLLRMGDAVEGSRYVQWLLRQCKVDDRRTRIVYGVSQNSSLKEYTLDHLRGYRDSSPVRVGNGAARHFQMDVFGEVILAVHALHKLQGWISDEAWSLVVNFAQVVSSNWRRKDRGVWEVRGEPQHFVYSKIMCWAALDRAANIATSKGKPILAAGWRRIANIIHEEVIERGWSDQKQAFVQQYDREELDASLLIVPFLNFLPPDDPRILSNFEAISRELADGPFVRRYVPSSTDDGLDGEGEGTFTLLSFWLIGNLIVTGQTKRAEESFRRIMENANHVGLFSEMIDPRTNGFLGNFPQAYSHVGLIHTAMNLNRALTGSPAETRLMAAD
jgi:GH15 family glucan-1,4-alpha-glucosidase